MRRLTARSTSSPPTANGVAEPSRDGALPTSPCPPPCTTENLGGKDVHGHPRADVRPAPPNTPIHETTRPKGRTEARHLGDPSPSNTAHEAQAPLLNGWTKSPTSLRFRVHSPLEAVDGWTTAPSLALPRTSWSKTPCLGPPPTSPSSRIPRRATLASRIPHEARNGHLSTSHEAWGRQTGSSMVRDRIHAMNAK